MNNIALFSLVTASLMASPLTACADELLSSQQIAKVVNGTLRPVLEKEGVPGMAVAVLYNGKTYFFNYGVADKGKGIPVTENTLFELGSVSKTFTGLAAAYASQKNIVNLNDPVSVYSAELTDEKWRHITMLDLATYTAGGLPLQLPDTVSDQTSLWQYYQHWQPQWAPGVMRNYSNASIGLFGMLAVRKSQLSFEDFMSRSIFKPLKLMHTFITVPQASMANYAWGYKDEQPIRVQPGMLAAEAYGVKSTTRDMATYLQANMEPESLSAENDTLKRAILTTQTRYYRLGNMFQGLGWEMYNWPVNSRKVVTDSGNDVALQARRVEPLQPAEAALPASWVHKTGATNGFGAYLAFIPSKKVGIVMLANKNYPNTIRVKAAYDILQALQQDQGSTVK